MDRPPSRGEMSLQQRFDASPIHARLNFIEANRLSINFCTSQGDHLLHTAAQYNITDFIMKLLSRKDIDLNPRNADGLTPLHIAAKNKNDHLVKTLLEAGADAFTVDKRDRTVLHHTQAPLVLQVVFDYIQLVKQSKSTSLVGKFFKSSEPERPVLQAPLFEFLMWKDEDGCTFLDNFLGKPQLLDAALRHPIVMEALRSCENNFFYNLVASRHNTQDIRKILEKAITEGFPVNVVRVKGCSVLHRLFEKGFNDICQFLVRSGEDPYERCECGYTAFHHAADEKNLNVISPFLPLKDPAVMAECCVLAYVRNDSETREALIRHGADLSLPEALMFALKQECLSLVTRFESEYEYSMEILFEILKFAIYSNQVNMFDSVKQKIGQYDREKLNLLMFEVVDMTELTDARINYYIMALKSLGADLNATNSKGKTLLVLAERLRRPGVVKKLEKLLTGNEEEVVEEEENDLDHDGSEVELNEFTDEEYFNEDETQ